MGLKKKVIFQRHKREILRALHRGRSVRSVAQQFGVCKSVICKIRVRSKSIFTILQQRNRNLLPPEVPKTEKALFAWIRNHRQQDLAVTSAMVAVKAKQIHDDLNELTDFSATSEWMNDFKRRYSIRTLKLKSKKMMKRKRRKVVVYYEDRSYLPDQIYRADELTLFWRVLPGKTTESKDPGQLAHCERLTVICCSNVNGTHKLKPLVVGSSRDPRLTKGFEVSVDYKFSDDATLKPDILRDWFYTNFLEEVTASFLKNSVPRKGILLLDNSVTCNPALEQLTSEDRSIITMFLPVHARVEETSAELARLEYKKLLLSEVVAKHRAISLRDALVNIRLAWDSIRPITIENTWKKIMHDNDKYSVEDYTPLAVLRLNMILENLTHMEIRHLANCMPGYGIIPDSDLREWLTSDVGVTFIEENSKEDYEEKVLHSQAVECLNTLLDWAQQNSVEEEAFLKVYGLKDLTLRMNMGSPVKEFFN